MKSPIFLLILTAMTAIISSCQSQPSAAMATSPTEVSTSVSFPNDTEEPIVVTETVTTIPVHVPEIVSPKSCASSNGPLPSLSNPEIPSAKRPANSSLGGGLAQSKEFTIELLLYCDSVFQPTSPEKDYHSDIGDLAIYYTWRYDTNIKIEKTFSYFGLEPDVILRLVTYTQGYVSQGQSTGVKFAPNVTRDFSKKSSLRFVYIAQGPFGQLAGVALSFDLQQVSDGLQPSNILVTPLSDIELQSRKNVLPTVVP